MGYYLHLDHLGSVVAATDTNGELIWDNEFLPFGDAAEKDKSFKGSFKFTGKDLDVDTGLYYFNARWYDPDTGRFVSLDPIRDGTNWYAYCANNPLKFVDLTGLFTEKAENALRDALLKYRDDEEEDDSFWKDVEDSFEDKFGEVEDDYIFTDNEEGKIQAASAKKDKYYKEIKELYDKIDKLKDIKREYINNREARSKKHLEEYKKAVSRYNKATKNLFTEVLSAIASGIFPNFF